MVGEACGRLARYRGRGSCQGRRLISRWQRCCSRPCSTLPLLALLVPRYYRYTGTTLPMHWNCQATQCLDGNLTGGCLQLAWLCVLCSQGLACVSCRLGKLQMSAQVACACVLVQAAVRVVHAPEPRLPACAVGPMLTACCAGALPSHLCSGRCPAPHCALHLQETHERAAARGGGTPVLVQPARAPGAGRCRRCGRAQQRQQPR